MNFEEKMQTHQWDQSHAPEIVRLFLALQWAQAQSTAGMKPVLAEFGLSTAEFDVLATLRNAPAPYSLLPGEIQKAVVITSGGLTKVLYQLEARQYLRRQKSEHDQRSKPVQLTETGQNLIETAMQRMVSETEHWLKQRLTDQEIRDLWVGLGKLV